MTIGEYLFQTRMQYANKMFDENYGNVSYVAENVVMKMRDILASVLKKYYGISPRDIYRKYSAILGNINYKLTKKMLDKQKTLQSEERMKA